MNTPWNHHPALVKALLEGTANTVEAGFDRFLGNLTTPSSFITVTAGHRDSIFQCLRASFEATAFFQSGSYGNSTNVRSFGDVDYFAVVPVNRLKRNSALTLSEVAEALRTRFPNTPGIRVDSPGVKVPFGGGKETIEIIPADETGTTKLGFRQFEIADGSGGWLVSAPESHKAYVDAQHDRLHSKVKPLIRFIKAWRYYRNVPIRSFYLELFVAKYCTGEAAIIYPMDVARILARLAEYRLADFADPRNLSGNISACTSITRAADALSKTENAATWAQRAEGHRISGRVRSAFDDWDLVFNGKFPALG